MTTYKLKSVLQFYQDWLDIHATCIETPDDSSSLNHLLWMTTKCLGGFLDDRNYEAGRGYNDEDKAHRWLGFIQGCLLCKGIFTLEELRSHSRI